MDLNLIQITFILLTLITTLVGLSVHLAEPHLPAVIKKLYRYGRFANNEESKIPTLQVPKRWFKHFYQFAAPLSTCVLFITLRSYLGIGNIPSHIYQLLDICLGSGRKPLVSPECTTLALILLTIQCWKRFYETQYVCIFSNGKINLGHYIIGFVHYVGVLACLVGESEGFFDGSVSHLTWNKLTFANYGCAFVFLWASYMQLRSNIILANLRKNKKGDIVTLQHKIPQGELFKYISSPLQFTEILMYLMLEFILWDSRTFHYVFIWVFSNQVGTALLGHWWYMETFKDYPKQRKGLIPWIL